MTTQTRALTRSHAARIITTVTLALVALLLLPQVAPSFASGAKAESHPTQISGLPSGGLSP